MQASFLFSNDDRRSWPVFLVSLYPNCSKIKVRAYTLLYLQNDMIDQQYL